jgi:signal transduction histidine kinase
VRAVPVRHSADRDHPGDGDGFDAEARTYGTGLQGIADRLAALDGTLEVRSKPGVGTTLCGRVPV